MTLIQIRSLQLILIEKYHHMSMKFAIFIVISEHQMARSWPVFDVKSIPGPYLVTGNSSETIPNDSWKLGIRIYIVLRPDNRFYIFIQIGNLCEYAEKSRSIFQESHLTGCRSDFRTATSLNFKLRYLYSKSLSKKWLLERHLLQILKLLNWWIWRILEHVILRSLKCS